jgi:hypothetical protein
MHTMTRDRIDQLWQQAMDEAVKIRALNARYHFAALVLEEGRERNLAAASEACRAFGKAGAVLMAAIRAKVSQ